MTSQQSAHLGDTPLRSPEASVAHDSGWSRRQVPRGIPDAVGVGAVVVVALALVLPGLLRGPYLGPYAFLFQHGLLAKPGVTTPPGGNDLVNQMIPWTRLNWVQVHAGHLPLWNPLSGLGLPQAFNWQAAPASLPSLVGYLVPLSAAFSVGVVVSFVVAGTGMYVFARLLGLAPLACAAGGIFFEISGPIVGWWGYPLGSVMGWTGWIFAGVLLVVNGRRRWLGTVFLALAIAFALLAGNPESLLVLGPMVLFFTLVLLIARAWHRSLRSLVRPVLCLVGASLLGAGLSAPVVLPSLQLTGGVERLSRGGSGFPPIFVFESVVPWVPHTKVLTGSEALWSSDGIYVGMITLTLCVTGLVLRWRRPPVATLGIMAVAAAGASFVPDIGRWAGDLPGLHTVYWSRALMPLAFALAALASVGVDAVARDPDRRRVAIGFTVGLAGGSALVLLTAIFDKISISPATGDYRWPAISIAVGIGAAVVLWRAAAAAPRPTEPPDHHPEQPAAATGRSSAPAWVAAALTLCGALALLWSNSAYLHSGPESVPTSAAARTLSGIVGPATVGLGAGGCPYTEALAGMQPETNVLYDIHEMAMYDPILSQGYFDSWRQATGQLGGVPQLATFCPEVTTTASARQFGIGYVIELPGSPGPPGSVLVARIRGQSLYRVPGSGPAVLIPNTEGGGWPADTATGAVVPVGSPNPSTWALTTRSSTTGVLRLHLTDEPGWSATLDGRPIPLRRWDDVMLQAHVPAGTHRVVVTYWPPLLTVGLLLAVVSVLGLATCVVMDRRDRRRPGPSRPGAAG